MTAATVTAWFNLKHGWLGVPLELPGLYLFQVMVSGFPTSVVSTEMVLRLPSCFEPVGQGRYRMHSLTLGGQPLGDLEVGVSTQIRRLDAYGALGLDFLRRFSEIKLDVRASQLTFTPLPPA